MTDLWPGNFGSDLFPAHVQLMRYESKPSLTSGKKIPNKFQDRRACTRRTLTLCNFAYTTRNFAHSGFRCLVVRAKKEVVGPVGHELSLTHGADGGRNSPAAGVQTLNEGGVGKEVTASGPFLVPD